MKGNGWARFSTGLFFCFFWARHIIFFFVGIDMFGQVMDFLQPNERVMIRCLSRFYSTELFRSSTQPRIQDLIFIVYKLLLKLLQQTGSNRNDMKLQNNQIFFGNKQCGISICFYIAFWSIDSMGYMIRQSETIPWPVDSLLISCPTKPVPENILQFVKDTVVKRGQSWLAQSKTL